MMLISKGLLKILYYFRNAQAHLKFSEVPLDPMRR